MKRKQYIPLGLLGDVENPELCLVKAGSALFSNYTVIRFSSRKALEAFNKKAGLRPLVYSEVPKGMAVWNHQREVA